MLPYLPWFVARAKQAGISPTMLHALEDLTLTDEALWRADFPGGTNTARALERRGLVKRAPGRPRGYYILAVRGGRLLTRLGPKPTVGELYGEAKP